VSLGDTDLGVSWGSRLGETRPQELPWFTSDGNVELSTMSPSGSGRILKEVE
jgi:hypothetical protein